MFVAAVVRLSHRGSIRAAPLDDANKLDVILKRCDKSPPCCKNASWSSAEESPGLNTLFTPGHITLCPYTLHFKP